MSTKKTLITTAVSSLLALGALTLSAQDDAAEMEKCYGIVKAGANDCAGPGHTCQGQANADASPDEYILLPAGTCDRIAGGEVKE